MHSSPNSIALGYHHWLVECFIQLIDVSERPWVASEMDFCCPPEKLCIIGEGSAKFKPFSRGVNGSNKCFYCSNATRWRSVRKPPMECSLCDAFVNINSEAPTSIAGVVFVRKCTQCSGCTIVGSSCYGSLLQWGTFNTS